MVSKGDGQIVLWPRYFDAARSRMQGRRVAKALAVAKPDAKWIEAAAKKAGFAPVLEEKAHHPGRPFEACGRVLVKPQGSKEQTLQAVARKMVKAD